MAGKRALLNQPERCCVVSIGTSHAVANKLEGVHLACGYVDIFYGVYSKILNLITVFIFFRGCISTP